MPATAVLPRILGDKNSGLVRLWDCSEAMRLPVKLGVHTQVRSASRVRATIDMIGADLAARGGELDPGGLAHMQNRMGGYVLDRS